LQTNENHRPQRAEQDIPINNPTNFDSFMEQSNNQLLSSYEA